MTAPMDLIRPGVHPALNNQTSDISRDAWVSRGWNKIIDPLYVWSAAIGLSLGIVLIAVDLAVRSGFVR